MSCIPVCTFKPVLAVAYQVLILWSCNVLATGKVYLRVESASATIRAAAVRQTLQFRWSISPIHSALLSHHPIPAPTQPPGVWQGSQQVAFIGVLSFFLSIFLSFFDLLFFLFLPLFSLFKANLLCDSAWCQIKSC